MDVLLSTGVDYEVSPVDLPTRVLFFPERTKDEMRRIYRTFLDDLLGEAWYKDKYIWNNTYRLRSGAFYDILPPDAEAGIEPEYKSAIMFSTYILSFHRVPKEKRTGIRNNHFEKFQQYLLEHSVLFSERATLGPTPEEHAAFMEAKIRWKTRS